MTPGAMANRNADAMARMLAAARVLADRFNLTTTGELNVVHRDPQLKALFQREAMALVLTELVAKTDPAAELPTPEARMADLTVAQLQERIDAADPETLDDLERLEVEGRSRKGVLEAIAKRRSQLEPPAPGEDAAEQWDAEGRPLPGGQG